MSFTLDTETDLNSVRIFSQGQILPVRAMSARLAFKEQLTWPYLHRKLNRIMTVSIQYFSFCSHWLVCIFMYLRNVTLANSLSPELDIDNVTLSML